jgi:uncharacterized protein (DUF1499 family)
MTKSAVAVTATGRWGTRLAWAAIVVVLGGVAAELAAGPGYRLGLWGASAGVQTMRWGATFTIGATAVALVALGMCWRAKVPLRTAAVALVVGLGASIPPLIMLERAQRLPRIHDITTDTANPPAFVAALPARKGARNPVEYPAATAAEQKRAYPDIAPLKLTVPPAVAFERAERVARSMGWEMLAASVGDGRIEATDTSLLFGFKDDIVIRVTADGGGSRVDVRSLSRVGVSDIGVNAKRVREYLGKLAAAG